MRVLNTIGKIEEEKITIFSNKSSYKIYEIAFIELKHEEVKIRKYIFLVLFIFNYIIYLNYCKDTFLEFFIVLMTLYFISFSLNINFKKYYLQLSFKNFKYVKVPIKKKELSNANILIEEYKKNYLKIDNMLLSKRENTNSKI